MTGGLSRHPTNFFAQLLVGSLQSVRRIPLPLLYADIEWCASQQLCEGISGVSGNPLTVQTHTALALP